jgi:hypothetical protein
MGRSVLILRSRDTSEVKGLLVEGLTFGSMQLQALRRHHPQWASCSEKKKEAEENKVVEKLKAIREERKRKAEIAYNVKRELGDSEKLSESEELSDSVDEDNATGH